MNAPDPVPQQMPLPVTAGAAPWWTSKQFDGLLITFLLALLAIAAHWWPAAAKITGAQLLDWIQKVTALLLAAGPLLALVQRVRSRLQPLVWGRKAALAHPATIAVVQTQARMAAAGIPTSVEELKATIGASAAKQPSASP